MTNIFQRKKLWGRTKNKVKIVWLSKNKKLEKCRFISESKDKDKKHDKKIYNNNSSPRNKGKDKMSRQNNSRPKNSDKGKGKRFI